MAKLVKIVDNKYVQIEEYKNPNICFNTNKYDDLEDYCTLRETFDPFKMFYENKKLKDNWDKLKEYIRKNIIYDDVGMKILDSSPLKDYIAELEKGSDSDDSNR